MINVIAVIPSTVRDTVKAMIDEGETPAALKGVTMIAGKYQDFTRGATTFTAVDFILNDESEIADKLKDFPEAEVIGAWDFSSGLQLGTSLVNMGTDESPDYQVTGTPTYSHADISKLYKTRKILDENGVEIGSVQEGFHKMLGQGDRL